MATKHKTVIPKGYELKQKIDNKCTLCDHPCIPVVWHETIAMKTNTLQLMQKILEEEYGVMASLGEVMRHAPHVKVRKILDTSLLDRAKAKVKANRTLVEDMEDPQILKEIIDAYAALMRQKLVVDEVDQEFYGMATAVTRMAEVRNRLLGEDTINVKGDFKDFMVSLVKEKGKKALKKE